MPTRNVVLTNHQHELIETLVRTGRYTDVEDTKLEDFIGQLGRHAARRAKTPR